MFANNDLFNFAFLRRYSGKRRRRVDLSLFPIVSSHDKSSSSFCSDENNFRIFAKKCILRVPSHALTIDRSIGFLNVNDFLVLESSA